MPGPDKRQAADAREVLLQFEQVGGFVKVTAIDPLTGVEAAIIGPAGAPEAALGDAARRRLDYVLGRRRKPARVKPRADKDGILA
jgi:2-keto-3-deoxy-L-rhamnonate aldolase RhmA